MIKNRAKGGSGKRTNQRDLVGELVADNATVKRGIEAKVADIKHNLAQWLDDTARSSEGTAITIALLETALDQYLVEHTAAESEVASAAADALDLIQPVLRRAVQRRRVALRLNAFKDRSLDIPINDKELSDRLTEMLNLLDALAAPLPKDAVRQFIADAAGPLGILLGYFVSSTRPQAEDLHNAPNPVPTSGPEVFEDAPEIKHPPIPFPVEEWS
jgi:hypothetical protein